MAKIIELEGVSKDYVMPGGTVHALRNVTLSVEEGEFLAVTGASGSGKSTLLYLLGLLVTPTAGRYTFRGRPLEGLSDKERSALRGEAFGFVFQSFHLVPQLEVVGNVLLGVRYRRNGSLRRVDYRRRARELLERVGLSHRLHHRPGELSNGEMQRVAVARALLGDPRVILADEPTGNLDEANGREIFRLLASLHREGRTVIVVTHDLRLAERVPRRIRLRDGEVTE